MAIGNRVVKKELTEIPFNYKIVIVQNINTPAGSEKLIEVSLPRVFYYKPSSLFPQEIRIREIVVTTPSEVSANIIVAPTGSVTEPENGQKLLEEDISPGSTVTISAENFSEYISCKRFWVYTITDTVTTADRTVVFDVKGSILAKQ